MKNQSAIWVPRCAAFTLIEMAIVISILSVIFASGIHLVSSTGVYARRSSADLLESMIERGRSAATSSRVITLIAIAEPGDLSGADTHASLGLFRVADWKTGQNEFSAEMIQRWQPVETGIVFASGEIDAVRNIIDQPQITLSYLQSGKEVRIQVHAVAFTPRGRLHWPTGSDSMMFCLAEGGYRGPGKKAAVNFHGTDRSMAATHIRIGRIHARSYCMNP